MTGPLAGRAALDHRRQPGPRPRDRARVRRRPAPACMLCARDADAARASRAPRLRARWRAGPARRWRTPADVSRPARRRPLCPTPRSTRSPRLARPGEQRRRLRPDGADRGGRLGRVGRGDRDQPASARCCCAARCCRTSSRSATARSSSSPAAARPTRCRASAPTPRRRPPSSASPRRWRSRCKDDRHRRQRDRARRAQHAACWTRCSPPAPSAVGEAFYERMVEDQPTRAARRSRRAPRWPCSSARRRATASPAGCSARSGIRGRDLPAHRDDARRDRRLHAAPHRARRTAGMDVGRTVSRGRRHRRLRPDRPEARRARWAARGSSPAPTSTVARAAALAADRPGAAATADWRTAVARPDVDVVIVATTNDALARDRARGARRRQARAGREAGGAHRSAELDPRDRRGRARADRLRARRLQPSLPPGAAARRASSSTPARSAPLMFVRGRYGHGGRVGYDREWRADPARSGGGELIDQGVHLIDLSRWFLGDFTAVDGFAHDLLLGHAGRRQRLPAAAHGRRAGRRSCT